MRLIAWPYNPKGSGPRLLTTIAGYAWDVSRCPSISGRTCQHDSHC